MQEIRIYDPERKPPHWACLVDESQYVVTHFDFETGSWRTARGEYSQSPAEETVFVFDTLVEAREYCTQHVEAVPGLFCRIEKGSSSSTAVATIYSKAVQKKHLGPLAARRTAAKGAVLLLASVLSVFVDWRMGGPVIFGMLIGSKFLTSGLALLVQGLSGMSHGAPEERAG